MKKVTFPFNDDKTLALTGGGTTSWTLSRIPRKLKNGRPAFLRGFWMEFSGTLTQAATTGKAFFWTEFWKFITQLRIARIGGQPRIKITGHSVRIWNALTNAGIDRAMKLPTDLTANGSGSAVNTAFTVRLGFRFDTPGLANKNMFVKPVALYQNGSLDIQYGNPATVFDSTITLTTGLTVKLFAELGSEGNVRDGVDIELFNIENTTTASGSTLVIPAGSYPFIAMAAEKFATAAGGGGDDHSLFSALHSTNFFPEELPSLSGDQIRDRFLYDQTMDSEASVARLGACLPLVYPEAYSDINSCALRADQDWQLTTTLSGSLANGHRLLLGRVFRRDPADIERTACEHGISLGSGTLQAEIPNTSQPCSREASHFWPALLLPYAAPTNVRTRSSRPTKACKPNCC